MNFVNVMNVYQKSLAALALWACYRQNSRPEAVTMISVQMMANDVAVWGGVGEPITILNRLTAVSSKYVTANCVRVGGR